jgi:hypothetical protein
MSKHAFESTTCIEPPTALRLEQTTIEKMYKLGFYQIKNFVRIPSVLRRRFGQMLLKRLWQALGQSMKLSRRSTT